MKFRRILSTPLRPVLRRIGYDITLYPPPQPTYNDFTQEDFDLIDDVRAFTKTSAERIHALAHAVEHIVTRGIPGALVESGVWYGGSMMAAALTLKRLGDMSRDIYLFDVFEAGWPKPSEADVLITGLTGLDSWKDHERRGLKWPTPELENVKANMQTTGYSSDKLHYVVGRVEDTVPDQAPETIALLRLDTDLYESTRHELEHLYPRLSSGGILIIDDYGAWSGAKQATDEFVEGQDAPLFLHRIDFTARLIVKP